MAFENIEFRGSTISLQDATNKEVEDLIIQLRGQRVKNASEVGANHRWMILEELCASFKELKEPNNPSGIKINTIFDAFQNPLDVKDPEPPMAPVLPALLYKYGAARAIQNLGGDVDRQTELFTMLVYAVFSERQTGDHILKVSSDIHQAMEWVVRANQRIGGENTTEVTLGAVDAPWTRGDTVSEREHLVFTILIEHTYSIWDLS